MSESDLCQLAKYMFMRFGIKSVSMDDISQAMGVSKKTLYQTIDDKKGLITSVLDQHMKEVRTSIEDLKSVAENPIHELLLISKFMTKMLKEISPHTIYDLKKYYPNHWKKIDQDRSALLLDYISKNLEKGIESGLYRSDLDSALIASLYLKIAIYVTDEKILDNPNNASLKLYGEFIKYHLRGIVSEAGMKIIRHYQVLLNE
ncbi:MAG: TetR/AcrR family transcriptional regulator [Saprospiraceae bacterium]|nr:TetR/AcrR family transcriptional regulator [Saprospiraceae bacterium]